jgi:non-heme chloroperoxidase
MAYIKVGEENSTPINLYYEDHGNGPAVVLIHGWPLNAASWEKQTRALLAAGHRVVAYDRRGAGDSSKPSFGYDYDTFAADLDVLMRTLDLRDAILIGFSMGTGECARYLGKYGSSRVRKVVFMSGVTPFLKKTADNPGGVESSVFDGLYAACVADRPAFFKRFLENFYNVDVLGPTGQNRVSDAVLQDSFVTALKMGPFAAPEQIRAWATDFRGDAKKISIPALVIHGEKDRTAPLVVAGQAMAALLKDGPHGFTWTHAEETNKALIDFII